MKHFLLLCLLPAFIIPAARGEVIGVETFDYTDDTFINGERGGVLWDFVNTNPASSRSQVPSAWLDVNLSNFDNVSAGSRIEDEVLITNNNSVRRPNNGSDELAGAIGEDQSAEVAYYRVDVTTPSTLPGSFGISIYDSGTERAFFGKPNNSGVFGIETTNDFGSSNSTSPVETGTTYTLVAKVDYIADRLSLFVDPDLSSTEPATATATIDGYTSNQPTTSARLGSGNASSLDTRWDNFVAATTWEELQATVVNTTADEDDGSLGDGASLSLREAVAYSPSGSVILFDPDLDGETITLTGENMLVSKSLTIDASTLPGGLTVDGEGRSRHFQVPNGNTLTLRGLTLTRGSTAVNANGNSAGGSILNFGRLNLSACTLTGNSSTQGGAIQNNGTCSIVSSTLSDNTAQSNGGAIFNFLVSGCSIVSSTLSDNSSGAAGGGISNFPSGSLEIQTSIVAGNTAPECLNIEGNFTDINNLIDVDPRLSPLGDYGGPVQTMHPLIGSPAIDAGGPTNPGGTDQRGFSRFVGSALDIGAVEAGQLFVVNNRDDQGSGSLRAALAAATTPGAIIRFGSGINGSMITLSNNGQLEVPGAANGLFIDASNIPGGVTISGDNQSRVFSIPAAATVAMHSLTIRDGKTADGENGGTETGSSVGDGLDAGSGGGISSSGTLSLISCTVSHNQTGFGGDAGFGGIDSSGDGGFGGNGGGIDSSGNLSLISCTVSHNQTGGGADGGGFGGGGIGGAGGGISSSVAH